MKIVKNLSFLIFIILSIFLVLNLEEVKFYLLKYFFNQSNKSFLITISSFIIFYTLSIILLLPIGIIFMPLSGFFFGTIGGVIVCFISNLIGLTIIFFLVKKNNFKYIDKLISSHIPILLTISKKTPIETLIALRLLGLMPFSIQNILSAYVSQNLKLYLAIPIIIMTPWLLSMSYLGTKVNIVAFKDINNLVESLQSEFFFIIIFITYLLIFLFVLRKIKSKII